MHLIIIVLKKNMNILGLMAIPPNDNNTEKYFKFVGTQCLFGLKELSMGMSSDYLIAINYKAIFLRIGSLILANDLSKFLLLFSYLF